MQGDFNNNLQTQDKSALPQTNPLENPSASFFSKYKLTISLIATMIIIAVLVTLYFLVINKPKEPIQLPPRELTKALLTVNEPKDQQATTSAQIAISGKTNPNNQVSVYTQTNEEIFESDQDGNFSGVLGLDEGPNEITITAFGGGGEEISETRSVVYVTNEEL